jgi:hypothetical protein
MLACLVCDHHFSFITLLITNYNTEREDEQLVGNIWRIILKKTTSMHHCKSKIFTKNREKTNLIATARKYFVRNIQRLLLKLEWPKMYML